MEFVECLGGRYDVLDSITIIHVHVVVSQPPIASFAGLLSPQAFVVCNTNATNSGVRRSGNETTYFPIKLMC